MDKSYITFFRELEANNNRPWFQANKARFDELRLQWLEDFGRLIAACSEWEPAYRWLDARASSFRIYRDTRFSADKTPYKNHFSGALTPRGKSAPMAGFYISAGLEPQYTGVYGGLWNPAAPDLKKLRKAMVDNIEEFEEIINNPLLLKNFPDWCGRALKTVPKGYPKDHPQAYLLRLIDLGREHTLAPEFFTDPQWPLRVAEIMQPLKPLNDFFNYSLFEE